MKALEMLDHVMVWIARTFTAGITLALVGTSLEKITALGSAMIFYSAFVAISLWVSSNPFSQVLLVLSALIAFTWIFVVLSCFDPGEMNTPDARCIEFWMSVCSIGSLSLGWSGFRRRSWSVRSSVRS